MRIRKALLAAAAITGLAMSGAYADTAATAATGCSTTATARVDASDQSRYAAGVLSCTIPQDLDAYTTQALTSTSMVSGNDNPDSINLPVDCAKADIALTPQNLAGVIPGTPVSVEVLKPGTVYSASTEPAASADVRWQVDPTVRITTSAGSYTVHVAAQFTTKPTAGGYTMTGCSFGFTSVS